MSFPLPENEAARLECLRAYNILDTPAEQAFDDITRLASYICGMPISVVSLLDDTRQWFKSSVGLGETETPRDQAFCTHAILQDGLMVVPNALEDSRFASNPLVTGSPHIRFYAGAPLVTSSGQALGTLCVIDRVPRTLTPEQAEALCALSRQVVALLELRRNVTEYKRTLLEKERFEQELQISLRLQQAIFDSADYSLISTDPQGVIQTFNRAAERMLGYSAEEVVGKVTPAILHDADEVVARAESLTQELGRSIAPGFEVFTAKIREGTPDENEWTYIRKDGSRFPIRLSATALRNEDGALTGYLGIAQDITARRQAELALQKSQEQLEAAQEIARMGSWEYDLATQKITWSKELFRLFGLAPEQGEPEYTSAVSLYAPEDAARLDTCFRRALTEGIGYELDLQGANSVGDTSRWYHTVGKPVFDAQGKLLRLAGTLVDITERKQIEEVLRSNEERFRLLTEVVKDYAIFALDTQGRVATWNVGAANLKGYSAEEILGRHFSVFYPQSVAVDEIERQLERELETACADGKYAGEGWRVRKDGTRFWANVTITPMWDAQGRLHGYSKVTCDITERKQIEEALRSNEERFRLLTEVVKDYAIFALDTQGRVATWNVGAAHMKGYSAEEILGRHFSVFYPQDVAADEIERQLEQARTDGRYDIEGWRVRKDGTWFWAGVTITPMCDEKGHLCGYSKIIRDLTERKRVEKILQEAHDKLEVRVQERIVALRKSEALFRAIFAQAAVGMAHVSLDGKWLNVNDRLCELVGYSREELSALTFQDITHPDDLDADLAYVAQVLAGEIATYSLEKRYLCKDGALVWINLTVALVREMDGTPQYFISIIEDISTRKQAQEALIESEKRYRFLADAMPQIIWTSSPDGNVDYYNQRWFDYTGMTLQETRDQGWQPILHSDDLQNCVDCLTHSLTTGERMEVELRLKGASEGGYRWHLARSVPRRNDAGEIVQWIGTSTDIEEVKQAQAALLRINEELEERVAKRTTELARSNTDLEQFAYVASHDLQEPLRMIGSYLELLQLEYGERLDDEAREYILYAVNGAVRMKALINDLLAYSRIGMQGKTMQSVAVDALLVEVLADLHLLIVGICAVITSDPLPTVFADASQLRQVLQNLISNALKFRGKEIPHVHISAMQGEGEWRFSVADNGIGMQARHLERIFVIFQRLHNKDKYVGTGIGLATCKRVVERHDGRIWVESEPGKGSTFFFTLPASILPASA